MKVCLIASNPAAKVPTTGYDLYVHFTHVPHWGKTPIDKSIAAVRKFGKVAKAGTFRFLPVLETISTVMAVGWEHDVRTVDKNILIIPLDGVPYTGKSPTSGFAAMHYYLGRGHNVTLCGFDMRLAPCYLTTKIHNPDYEVSVIEDFHNQGLISRI